MGVGRLVGGPFHPLNLLNVLQRLHKQPSQCSERRSHEKYPATGVVAAKSTPAVRTRDYSAFVSIQTGQVTSTAQFPHFS